MQWRKIKSNDYGTLNLIIDNSYKSMNDSEYVYNSKGEQLFWYNHIEPEKLPLNYFDIESAVSVFGEYIREHFKGEEWKLTEPLGKGFHTSVKGFDCDGVPVFSHYSADYIGTHYTDIDAFEPLTVGMVKLWFGWFLYQLENSVLQSK
mgnify:CR=1 FL=1